MDNREEEVSREGEGEEGIYVYYRTERGNHPRGWNKVGFLWIVSSDDRKKLRDNNVLDILNNDVNADAITTISLMYCRGITNATLMCIADKCTQLETLRVDGCDMISDAGITDVAKKNNKLRNLNYSYCTRVTDAALEVITNECQQLEGLYANGCGHSKLPFDFGTKLPNLTGLDLRNNNISILPESLGQLADKCKDFRISGNPLQQPPPEIVERGFRAIARYYQDLQNDQKKAKKKRQEQRRKEAAEKEKILEEEAAERKRFLEREKERKAFTFTTKQKEEIIQEDGTALNFYWLSDDGREKVRDNMI